MAAEKFFTAFRLNTDRMTVILLYAMLEWTLILMLLLNGVFSYLIARFAAFFGLQPPCAFCARVDHLFEPAAGDGRRRRRSACRDLVCEEHAAEVAGLGYCARHRRLAEAEQMCEDCSSSSSLRSPGAALLAWMKRSEEGEKDLSCSCCGVALESGFYSPYLLFRPSCEASEHDQPKGNFVEQIAVGGPENPEKDAGLCREKVETDLCPVEAEDGDEEKVGREDGTSALVSDREVKEEEALIHFDSTCRMVGDASLEVLTLHPGNTWDDERLVPIELIDSTTKSPVVFSPVEEDLIELEHVGAAQKNRVVDIGSITVESKLVFSAAEKIDIIKESSEHAEVEQDARDLHIKATMEEEKEMVSATQMTDIVEAYPLEISGLLGDLHAGSPVTARADTMVGNGYEVDNAQHGPSLGMICVSREEKPSTPGEHRAIPEDASTTLDIRGISGVEKPTDNSSYEVNEAQKGATALCVRSILVEEDALASVDHRADGIEDSSKEMDDAKQCAISLDVRNAPAEEHILTFRISMEDILEQKLQNSAALPASELISECLSDHQFIASQAMPIAEAEANVVVQDKSLKYDEDLPGTEGFEEDIKLIDLGADCEISIGSEICQQEHIEHVHLCEPILMLEITQDQLSEGNNAMDEEALVSETESVIAAAQNSDHISAFQQNNESEEERAPATPTHINAIYGLNKRFLFGKRESGTESLDGSVASEFEGCEGLSIDQLKAALESERKALSALYSELEEERSSSAIAANQTMAMITRLQEEKAAMQMEALQYQRMMEEQSEYDQEALHLLNELMMKREKEKQELEKELEMYRKRVHHYEAKERKRQMTKEKVNCASGTSSTSSSAEDSDDLLFESHDKDGFSYNADENNQNTPADDVLCSGTDQVTAKHLLSLKESLADFEEERLSIVEQLRTLERKLITLDNENPSNLEAIEHIPDENGYVLNGHYKSLSDDLQDYVNGFSENLGASRKIHRECRNTGCQGKRLLPLFDAISDENEDDACTKEGEVGASPPETISNLVEEHNKIAVVEEIDNIYERLDALEGDREFLKHCVNSLKKGDKGIHLLQEILEHLRDLRSVELRARNSSDAFA